MIGRHKLRRIVSQNTLLVGTVSKCWPSFHGRNPICHRHPPQHPKGITTLDPVHCCIDEVSPNRDSRPSRPPLTSHDSTAPFVESPIELATLTFEGHCDCRERIHDNRPNETWASIVNVPNSHPASLSIASIVLLLPSKASSKLSRR